jgi:hypothetical protein
MDLQRRHLYFWIGLAFLAGISLGTAGSAGALSTDITSGGSVSLPTTTTLPSTPQLTTTLPSSQLANTGLPSTTLPSTQLPATSTPSLSTPSAPLPLPQAPSSSTSTLSTATGSTAQTAGATYNSALSPGSGGAGKVSGNDHRSAAFLALRETVAALTPCFGVLAPLQQSVLELRFGLAGLRAHSRRAVARALGISNSRTRSLERGALRKLRRATQRGSCHGGASPAGASIVFAPEAIGGLLESVFGATATPENGPGASVPQAAPATPGSPGWPAGAGKGSRALLTVFVMAGGLLLLAGVVLRRGERSWPLPADDARRREHGEAAPARRSSSRPGPVAAVPSELRRRTRHGRARPASPRAAKRPPAGRRPDGH